MSMSPHLPNLTKFYTAIREPQRDYLNYLSTIEGLTHTKTVYELVTRGVAAFLAAQPWEKDAGFEWIKPESYYTLVAGKRHRNGDWLSFNCKLGDIPSEEGAIIKCKDIMKTLDRLASTVVIPWLSSRNRHTHGNGQNTVYYTAICWMIDELYPESVYRRPAAKPVTVSLAALQSVMNPGRA